MAITDELLTAAAERSPGVQSLIDQLQHRFADVHPEVLTRIVESEYRRLAAGATVMTYLSVLTLRAAVRHLTALDERSRTDVRHGAPDVTVPSTAA